MKRLLFIFMALVAVLTSCGSNGENVEITSDTILTFGNYRMSTPMSVRNHLVVVADNFDSFRFPIREKYDFDAYNDINITLKDSTHNIKQFEVYEMLGWRNELIVAPDVKGIALQKANGAILTFLVSKEPNFLARRGQIKYAQGITYVPNVNQPGFKYTFVGTYKFNRLRIFLVPMYQPTNKLEPVFTHNVESLMPPFAECLQPSKDTLMMFPCYGAEPQIICQDNQDGRSLVTIKDAKGPGQDETFYVYGRFSHQAPTLQYFDDRSWREVSSTAKGTSLCLDNGSTLGIMQFPMTAEKVKAQRIDSEPVLMDNMIKVILKDKRRTELYGAPIVISGIAIN